MYSVQRRAFHRMDRISYYSNSFEVFYLPWQMAKIFKLYGVLYAEVELLYFIPSFSPHSSFFILNVLVSQRISDLKSRF